jgi:hypothetical protein
MPILRHASGSHIAPTSTLSETRHLPSLSANRPKPQRPASQRRSPPVLRQNVGGRVARRDGQVTQVGAVCCEQVNLYLRQHSYIYIWGEVREIWPQFFISLTSSSAKDWRRPPHPVYTADYATYVQILTWFFDSPSTLCPFSVHRMALAGKELGKDVGQWFGPSTAAGAIKCVDVVIACRLNVDNSSDLWSKASQKHRSAFRSQSTAKSSKQMSTRHHIRPPNLLVPASCQDGEDVGSLF